MKSGLKIFFIALLFLTACKAQKMASNSSDVMDPPEAVSNEKPSSSFTVTSIDNISKEDLLYHIIDLSIIDEVLIAQVKYGGGCKPHIFELVTDGIIDRDGGMEFYMLHKTHNDMCKALLIQDITFDLARLYSVESNILKYILVNNVSKIDLN